MSCNNRRSMVDRVDGRVDESSISVDISWLLGPQVSLVVVAEGH